MTLLLCATKTLKGVLLSNTSTFALISNEMEAELTHVITMLLSVQNCSSAQLINSPWPKNRFPKMY